MLNNLSIHNCSRLLILLSAATLPYSASALASESHTCIELAKECFAYAGDARESCFNAVSGHPFCRETRTGQLAAKRAQFSSLVPPNDQDGPSFLGPNLVNRDCLHNFDNAWSVGLINGNSSAEEHQALERNLRRCARVPSSDILRP
jgi:hypothetical protein